MSLDRHDHSNIAVMCDTAGCHEHFDSNLHDPIEALQAAKDAGWTGVRASPVRWNHLCPACACRAATKPDPLAGKQTYDLKEIGR